jgi:pilus assembly protein CpaB
MTPSRPSDDPSRSSYRWTHALLLVAALGFGGLGVVAARGYIDANLSEERARLAERGRTVGVIVARDPLQAGERVEADTMAVREVPARLVDPSMIPAEDFERVQGRRIRLPMADGEPLRLTGLVDDDGAFSARVGHGIRAMTIEVDEVNSLSGMLRPGDRIDLLLTLNSSADARGPVAAPLMQDLNVLATGSSVRTDPGIGSGAPGFRAITVEVTPLQAQKLVLAQRSGRLTALLRHPEDRVDMPQAPLDLGTLLGLPEPGPGSVELATPEIIVGGTGPIRVSAASSGAQR